jgi:hypothetical protein
LALQGIPLTLAIINSLESLSALALLLCFKKLADISLHFKSNCTAFSISELFSRLLFHIVGILKGPQEHLLLLLQFLGLLVNPSNMLKLLIYLLLVDTLNLCQLDGLPLLGRLFLMLNHHHALMIRVKCLLFLILQKLLDPDSFIVNRKSACLACIRHGGCMLVSHLAVHVMLLALFKLNLEQVLLMSHHCLFSLFFVSLNLVDELSLTLGISDTFLGPLLIFGHLLDATLNSLFLMVVQLELETGSHTLCSTIVH